MGKLQFRSPSGIFPGGWVAPGSWEKMGGRHIYPLIPCLWDKPFRKRRPLCLGEQKSTAALWGPGLWLPPPPPPKPRDHWNSCPSILQLSSLNTESCCRFDAAHHWASDADFQRYIGEEAEMEKTNWVIFEFAAVKSISKLQPCRPTRLPWTQWRYNHGVDEE